MRARSAALPLLAGVVCGCGHHRAAVPHLSGLPPTAMQRDFVAHVAPSRWRGSARYARLIRAEAAAARAQPVAVRMRGRAAAVTLAVSDPAPFLAHRLKRFLDRTGLTSPTRDAAYLLVVDAKGRRVLEWKHVANEGELWIRPELVNCGPIRPISLPYGTKHPRCPA